MLCTVSAYAQFDSLLFTVSGYFNYQADNIYALEDYNRDGYDDILIYNCELQKAFIYNGGNPMDTLPDVTLNVDLVRMDLIDVNGDGDKDIIIKDNWFNPVIKIYFAGDKIDTIPNITFRTLPGVFFTSATVIPDFNGDGKEEFVIFDPDLRYSPGGVQYGALYFYNTESVFDTIPHYVIMGDSANKIRIYTPIQSTGDLNGDGYADFTLIGYQKIDNNTDQYFRRFYFGNPDWNFEPLTFYFNFTEPNFAETLRIINDLNDDGFDDMITRDYTNLYPYYFYNVVLWGGPQFDTIPDCGLNTQNEGLNSFKLKNLGDVNGDKYNDFMGAALNFGYQNVRLWVGGSKLPEEAKKTWYGTSSGFGRILAAVGDVNGDGVNDIAIGSVVYYEPINCNIGNIYIFGGDTSVVTDINEPSVNKIEEKILEIFPNPFNGQTTISYSLQSSGRIKIILYDILGEKIITITNQDYPKGEFHLKLDTEKLHLSSGVYVIQLEEYENGNLKNQTSKKISLLK